MRKSRFFFASPYRAAASAACLLALVVFGAGCGRQTRSTADREAEAQRLYDRANLMVRTINEGNYSYDYINFHYQQAMKNIDRIVAEYPDTEYGRKVQAGELNLGPYTIDHFRTALLAQLGDMKEATESVVNCAIYLYDLPEAKPAESHAALAQILETLCRLVRSDEAMIFPTLPQDQLYAQETIVREVAQSTQHDLALSILEGASDATQQPALAAAYGEGLAIGGTKLATLEELAGQYPTPEKTVEIGILRGMAQREKLGYRDQFDKIKQKQRKDALAALQKSGQASEKSPEEAVHYDVAAYYKEKFGANPPAEATTVYASLLALEGQWDEANALVEHLDQSSLATVVQDYYEHQALTGGLTGGENLHRQLGLSGDNEARCELKLVELLAANARYAEADAVEQAGMKEFPSFHDQFVRSRMHGVFYSREQLFYLDSKTIPSLPIKDPAIAAEVLLDWFLSPNRLLKGSSWGADEIIFKYFSMQKEGRPVSRKLNKVD
jgi:hypothetical protein